MSSSSFKNIIYKMCLQMIYLMDLTLNNFLTLYKRERERERERESERERERAREREREREREILIMQFNKKNRVFKSSKHLTVLAEKF